MGRQRGEESFNDWGEGGRGMSQVCPRFGKERHENSPLGDLFDQPPGEMSSVRGKLADHVADHVVLSPEGVDLMTSPGTESSYPHPPQSLKHSEGDENIMRRLIIFAQFSIERKTLFVASKVYRC